MAEGKNKIVVYADWLDNFEDLTDEELGKLMRHFFMYVNDMNPVLDDRLLSIAWKPIQATLKRDLKKWESFVDKQKANGKKGGRPKTQKTQALIQKPKKADSVSVSDSVLSNDNKKEDFDFLKLVEGYAKEIGNGQSDKWIESLYMGCNLKDKSLAKLVQMFNVHLMFETNGDWNKDFLEYRKHCGNWIRQQYQNGKIPEHTKDKQKGSI